MMRAQAELAALDLWDCLLAENDHPGQVEIDAGKARFFRRVQVIAELSRKRGVYLEAINYC
jgi:hypothetical protein